MESPESSFFDLGDNTALVCVDHQQYQKMVVPQLIDAAGCSDMLKGTVKPMCSSGRSGSLVGEGSSAANADTGDAGMIT